MYLLDTCVFSELFKKKPSQSVKEWILDRNENLFSVSSLTFGEIKKGIVKTQDNKSPKRTKDIHRSFCSYL